MKLYHFNLQSSTRAYQLRVKVISCNYWETSIARRYYYDIIHLTSTNDIISDQVESVENYYSFYTCIYTILL